MARTWYSASEVAGDILGMSVDQFYRTREILHTRDRLPRPMTLGRMRFDKSSIDAWRTRNHPLAAPQAANDTRPPSGPGPTDELARAYLRGAYAGR